MAASVNNQDPTNIHPVPYHNDSLVRRVLSRPSAAIDRWCGDHQFAALLLKAAIITTVAAVALAALGTAILALASFVIPAAAALIAPVAASASIFGLIGFAASPLLATKIARCRRSRGSRAHLGRYLILCSAA